MMEPDNAALLAGRFEQDRPHLRAVAQRILGSPDEAEDAVQEAWVRLSRSDTTSVDNLTGWLTTVVSRICLDMLRSRTSRPSLVPEGTDLPEPAAPGPEHQAELADAIGPALMLVLDTLTPAERLAFVLHDMFAVPFPQIAEIVGTTPAAARQLASRARRRVQGRAPTEDDDVARRRAVVDAFLAASREGDFAGLLALLDPDVKLRAADECVRMGVPGQVDGPDAVARVFSGRAKTLRTALLDGAPGAVWMLHGSPKVVFAFTIVDGQVTAIAQLGDPEALAAMEVQTLPIRR